MSDDDARLALMDVAMEVIGELERAQQKQKPFNSAHEGYAVILEELDELWDEVKRNEGYSHDARLEAIQVAAMAMRYVLDISESP